MDQQLNTKIMFKWYFYATSHCKGPCDVVGGTVKWPATKASLQRVYSFQIMTPGQFFEWAPENISGMHFKYSSTDVYKEETFIFLEEGLKISRNIRGTQKLHCFIPQCNKMF